MSNKFEIFKSPRDFQYYFRLKARNGQIILASEGYTSKQGCQNGIASVKVNAPYDFRYERKNGISYTFNLKASNGEIIGRSESYTTSQARENGIASVKENAPTAGVVDLS
jgi:uncharacterized protein YegP (UPF0339 family)